MGRERRTNDGGAGPGELDPGMVLALLEGDADDDAARLAAWVTDGNEARDLPNAVQSVRHARLASRALRSGRTDELVRETRRALDAAPTSSPPLLFLVGSLLQACFRFTGDAELGRLALDVLGRVADRVDMPRLAVPARGLMTNIHMMRGALHRAVAVAEAAVALAEATGFGDGPAPAMAWQFRGYVLFEWNRLKEAEEALQRAWDLGEGSRGVRSGVARVLAQVRALQGDAEGGDAWLERLEALVAEPLTLRNREWLAAVRAGHALGPGAFKEIESWLRAQGYAPADAALWDDGWILTRLQELDHALALLEATSQWPSVLAVAGRIAPCARAERKGFAVRALTAEGVALEALGRPREADASFARALTLGADGGFVRAFLEGSPLRIALLARAAAGGSEAPEATRVLEAGAAGGATPSARLTPTQADVLRKVASGASNKAIAQAMGISVATVKTHLRAVFQRLDVSSRTHAVARGRELGLL